MTPEFICDTKQELKQDDVDKIVELLKDGGLCILPSDSSYILTGLVTDQKVSRDIDLLLERNGAPMSLAFGDLKKVTEKIDFHNQGKRQIIGVYKRSTACDILQSVLLDN